LARRFLALPDWRKRTDSLFCGNDALAIAAMGEFRKYGIIPGIDVSVIGMDDVPAASQTYPPLTTVRKPRGLIGAAAAELLLKKMKSPEKIVEKQLFPGELIIRDSVVQKRKNNENES